MDSTHYMRCKLKVDTKSRGWHKTLTRMLGGIKEVTYTIDAQKGIACVSGRINPNTLLLLLEKAGKHAELLRVDSGYPRYGARRSLLHEDSHGYYYSPLDYSYHEPMSHAPLHYSQYEPITPAPVDYSYQEPITHPVLPPYQPSYYEPGFDFPQQILVDDAESDSSSMCSIM
ncbi:hypothetical protein TorRG33x02_101600 [Trema orientale]|uniref:Heavy metal-associated domain containing protein n=1 Tax=Trema orientale TaxID=63057 RepID=A0A2P5F8K0_TREOI|nr:hypothetical protein TorRG33x02_101600 [Trema orientale]